MARRKIDPSLIGKIPDDAPGEGWAEIPDFEGVYAASSLGRVFSIYRRIPWVNGSSRIIGGRFLTRSRHTGQYHLALDGDTTMVQPATAILMTFVRAGLDNEVAVVVDKMLGPCLGNVEWRDKGDYCVQKFEATYGAAAKITGAQVREILSADLAGHAAKVEIAKKYDLTVSHIYRLLRGENQITASKR